MLPDWINTPLKAKIAGFAAGLVGLTMLGMFGYVVYSGNAIGYSPKPAVEHVYPLL